MRIVFMGTPDFAVPCLKRLVADGQEVALVVTQADKPRGRGQRLMPPPVKEYSLKEGLPVFQPASLRTPEALERLREARPDLIVVVAYGKILPEAVLDLPPLGCINVHASLLPRYRGAAPIQWMVLNGETQAGVTTMRMDAGLDTGDMLLKKARPLPEDMTAGELQALLAEDGAQLLAETLEQLEAGTLTQTPQDETLSCYAPMLSKALCPLDFSKNARVLHNQVRGLNPWPTATAGLGGHLLKIHRSRVGPPCHAVSGTVVKLNPFTVACGEGTSLELLEVQYEGARRMTAEAFLCGHPVTLGELLT